MSAANRKRRIGQVISDKMDKTVVVAVQWRQRHPVYRKSIRRISKFHAHDEQNDARIGDRVLIVETKPLSRLKRWRIAEILERHEVPEIAPQEIGAEIEEEITQSEAAVAVADIPQTEMLDTVEQESTEEPEQELVEEPEQESVEEPEQELVEEPEQESVEEPEQESAEEPEQESVEEPEQESVEEPEQESAEEPEQESAEEPEQESAEEPDQESAEEPETSMEEEIGRSVEERESKEGS